MDLKELERLLQLLEEKQIAEFELEESGTRLRIRKAGPPGSAQPQSPPAASAAGVAAGSPARPAPGPSVAAVSAAAAAFPAPEPAEAGLVTVKSPIVGTFYRSPDPNSPAFVNVGDQVKVGQVLCIIEAMKLMNEIEAEVAGEVIAVLPANGQPVQYGDALFTIRPAR